MLREGESPAQQAEAAMTYRKVGEANAGSKGVLRLSVKTTSY